MNRILLLCMFALATGCSNLIDHPDQCGNGVIDPGEDCDSSTTADCDNTCRLLCPMGTDGECGGAGTAYKCGADLICHAPSGVFTNKPTLRFNYAVGQGTIADLDGDKIGDVVGFSDVNIDVRFGDLEGTLATRATAIVPFANTNIALRRPTDDPLDRTSSTSDIILPTADGIAGFTARNKSLVSIPFTNAAGDRGACATVDNKALPAETFSIDKHHLAFVSRYFPGQPKAGQLVLSVMDPALASKCAHVDLAIDAPDQSPGATDQSQQTILIDHYDLLPASPSTDITAMIAISSPAIANAPTAALAVARFDDVGGTFSLVTTQALTVATAPFAFARATDPAVQKCPALYTVKSDGSGIDYYAGKTDASLACTVNSPGTPTTFGPGMFPTGHAPIVPRPTGAPASLAPDLLAVVTVQGLGGETSFYKLTAGVPGVAVFESQRPMYPIRAADIDNNGTDEVIGIVGTKVGGGQPDIEVLYRAATPTDIGFVPYRIPTVAAPTYLDLGDFDGNGITDIAYTEQANGHQRLMISYGTPDRPLDPVEIATFTKIVAMSLIDVSDSIEPATTVLDDLMVIDVVPAGKDPAVQTPLLAILHGNPQRSMFAYFDPRPQPLPLGEDSTFVAAITGSFVAATTAPDLMAIERKRTLISSAETFNIWTAAGRDVPPKTDIAPGFVDDNTIGEVRADKLALSGCPPATTVADADRPLCLASAQFTPWRLPDGKDVVIAADGPAFDQASVHPRFLFTIDPTNTTQPVQINLNAKLPDVAPVVSMWPGDLRENGTRQLVVSLPVIPFFGQTGTSTVKLCDVDTSGRVTGCDDLSHVVDDLKDFECGAAETGRIAEGGRFGGGALGPQGLLALCKDDKGTDVFHVHMRDGVLHADRLLKGVQSYLFLSVGDINGDGADDIGGITFDPVTQTPIVFIHLQCEAHDTQCIADNTRDSDVAVPQ